MKKHEPLSFREEELAHEIVNCAFVVHKALGPGLVERVYEACFCHELSKCGLSILRQVDAPIEYDGVTLDEGLRLDVLVEQRVVCELKAVDVLNPLYRAQLLSYMKLTRKRLGFLINFNVTLIRDGIKRMVL